MARDNPIPESQPVIKTLFPDEENFLRPSYPNNLKITKVTTAIRNQKYWYIFRRERESNVWLEHAKYLDTKIER